MKKKKKKHSSGESKGESYEIRFKQKTKQEITRLLSGEGYTFEENYHMGINAYYEPLYVDFYVTNLAGFSNGLSIDIAAYLPGYHPSSSLDSFLEFIVWNIKNRYPCPSILIIPDSGLRSHHIDYLKKSIDGNKLLHVFTLEEFMQWWINWGPDRAKDV